MQLFIDRCLSLFRSAMFSTTTIYSILSLLIILGIFAYPCIQTLDLGYTIDIEQLIPSSSEGLQVFNQLKTYFPVGLLSHYSIVVVTSQPNNTVMSVPFFTETNLLAHSIIDENLLSPQAITTVSYADQHDIKEWEAQLLLTPNSTLPFAPLYSFMFKGSVSAQNVAALVDLITPFDPNGDQVTIQLCEIHLFCVFNRHYRCFQASPFVSNIRSLLDIYNARGAQYGFSYYLTGGACGAIDAVDNIFDMFPTMISITVGVVFFIVAIMFRSLFVPIRLLLTIALPICLCYGIAILIFQKNKFDAFSDKLKTVHDIYWLTPIMSFSILVGLGLDYDVTTVQQHVRVFRSVNLTVLLLFSACRFFYFLASWNIVRWATPIVAQL